MDCEERLMRLERHLRAHPADYQASVAMLKARSDAIEGKMRRRRAERLGRVAEYKRRYYGKEQAK